MSNLEKKKETMKLCQPLLKQNHPPAEKQFLLLSTLSNRLNRIPHRPILAQNLRILQHPPPIHITHNTLMNRLRRQSINRNTRHRAHSNHTRNRISLRQHTTHTERNNIQALLPIHHLARIHRLKQPLLRRALNPPRIPPNPQAPELVLLRAPKAHENKPKRVDIAPRLVLHVTRRADPRELLRRLHGVGDSGFLRFFEVGVGVDGGAERPDAAADAPAAEALEEHVGQVVEVVVQDLGYFGVGAVFFGERAAGQAVDVLDCAGGEALLEDFGADEAGGTGEDDFGHFCGCLWVIVCGVVVNRRRKMVGCLL